MSFSNAICLSGSQGQKGKLPGISNEVFISHLLLRDGGDTNDGIRDLYTRLGPSGTGIKKGSPSHLGYKEEGQGG